jgi:hyperosmotically inducible periplasmic protein
MKPLTLSVIFFSALALCAFGQSLSATATPADNTAVNTRDRSGETKTSGDQSNSSGDIDVSAGIRRAIVKDHSLSMRAKNVKIITANGVVTLRGPVKTQEEKAKVEELAKANAGNAKVESQLEVKTGKKSK